MKRRTVLLVLLLLTTGGCPIAPSTREVSSNLEVPRERLPIAVAVTVLPEDYAAESLAGCVERRLRRLQPSIRYHPGAAFRDSLFPWFEPRTLPSSSDELAAVLEQPLVRARIADLGIRYVIRLSGDLGGSSLGAGGPVAGTYQSARLDASLLDLHSGQALGGVSAHADGVETMTLIPPFVLSPYVHDTVCEDVAGRLAPLLGQ